MASFSYQSALYQLLSWNQMPRRQTSFFPVRAVDAVGAVGAACDHVHLDHDF